MNEEYFQNNFNTQLSPKDEAAYTDWVKVLSDKTGRDRTQDTRDYDLRGLWKNEHPVPTNDGHFTDTYKKPNHPSFSVESMYNNTPNIPFGGTWQGGVWGRAGDSDTFTPSLKMLTSTHDKPTMTDYFNRNEPNVKLILK